MPLIKYHLWEIDTLKNIFSLLKKIVKININDDSRIKNLVLNIIGSSLTPNKSRDIVEEFFSEGVITEREQKLMNAAISSRLLQGLDSGNEIRADIMKNMLLALIERG